MNLLILATAPVIIILIYVYIRDKYEKEPLGLLLKALLAGALTTIPIILVNSWLEGYKVYFEGLQQVAYIAFVVAGFVEELFKFAALYLLIWGHREFNEKFDGIVYAVFISLGFALMKILCMYLIMAKQQDTCEHLQLFRLMPYLVLPWDTFLPWQNLVERIDILKSDKSFFYSSIASWDL